MRPHSSQALTSNLSEEIINRSSSNWVAPYPIRQSRSISPNPRGPLFCEGRESEVDVQRLGGYQAPPCSGDVKRLATY
ncbi:hypothetical protein LshimejAT787_1702530 [Lyophyllum shimeji]|uniref:Uncharacterized protein n=1 Tax=Lyophyllum shimeji TaxID=47721 RepID=A0A9P3Q0S0_LYOSH|nr:hypothetical protein LshimejAT787_1702530 [Lyophyllum shimeji]